MVKLKIVEKLDTPENRKYMFTVQMNEIAKTINEFCDKSDPVVIDELVEEHKELGLYLNNDEYNQHEFSKRINELILKVYELYNKLG